MSRRSSGESPVDTKYIPALGVGWLTPVYDAVVALTTRERRFRNLLIDQVAPPSGIELLDLGCGTGSLAIGIKRRHPTTRITGVDGDPKVLQLAARKTAREGVEVHFDRALANALPYPDASFDRVVSSLFFHHLSWRAKQEAAAEALRVLRPGGELHVVDWGRPNNGLMRLLFLVVQFVDGFESTSDNVAGRLVELFASVGFEGAVRTATLNTPLGTLSVYRAARPILSRSEEAQRATLVTLPDVKSGNA